MFWKIAERLVSTPGIQRPTRPGRLKSSVRLQVRLGPLVALGSRLRNCRSWPTGRVHGRQMRLPRLSAAAASPPACLLGRLPVAPSGAKTCGPAPHVWRPHDTSKQRGHPGGRGAGRGSARPLPMTGFPNQAVRLGGDRPRSTVGVRPPPPAGAPPSATPRASASLMAARFGFSMSPWGHDVVERRRRVLGDCASTGPDDRVFKWVVAGPALRSRRGRMDAGLFRRARVPLTAPRGRRGAPYATRVPLDNRGGLAPRVRPTDTSTSSA